MLEYYTLANRKIETVSSVEEATWINLVNPSEEEIQQIKLMFDIDEEFLTAPLDNNERSRLDYDDNALLVIIRVSQLDPKKNIPYISVPLGFILLKDVLITISSRAIKVLHDIIQDRTTKNFTSQTKEFFFLYLLLNTATLYLDDLKHIDVKINNIEGTGKKQLITNSEVYELLKLQKSLVYFATSLRANEKVMQRLTRKKFIKFQEELEDLLDSAIVENTQALELTVIYTNILANMMNAFGSTISNNINNTMKVLTSFSIILMILTLITGFYGMNVNLPFQHYALSFVYIAIFGIILCTVVIIFFFKKNFFR